MPATRVATPKRPSPLVSRRRLTAPSPRGIRHLSKEALRQHLMNNSLDTSGTRQQMVSLHLARHQKLTLRTSAQRANNHQTSVWRVESTSTSEARDPIAHKNDSDSDSSEAPAKPPSKRPRKRQKEHTPLDKLLRRSISQKKAL